MDSSKSSNKTKISRYVKENKKISKGFANIIDVVESLVYAIAVVVFVFLFIGRLSIVDGKSMNNTLSDKDYLFVSNPFFTYDPANGDIVVISGKFGNVAIFDEYGNQQTIRPYDKPLVKRVIATGNQQVVVNFKDNTVTIDGIVYNEDYAYYLDRNGNPLSEENKLLAINAKYSNHNFPKGMEYDASTYTLSMTVPEGHIFAMGDNRLNSSDSREAEIGFIRNGYVVGKVVFRLLPFNKVGGVQ